MSRMSVVYSGAAVYFVSFAILLSAIIIFKPPSVLSQAYIRHQGVVHYLHQDGTVHTLAWAVKIKPMQIKSLQNPSDIAQEIGLINVGKIGEIPDCFLFTHPLYYPHANTTKISNVYQKKDHYTSPAIFFSIKNEVESKLLSHPAVAWFKQEIMRYRSKRQLEFRDPYFPNQWHLQNALSKGMDMNLTGLWNRNITGRGVTVCVVDDGLEWTNADIRENYSPEGSWDLNDNDQDPMPSNDGKRNEHGTRCAGEIAAAKNDYCGVGVAFEARISGLKILDGKMTDSLEATAFNKNMEINDIYSCSWGPEDDGKTVDGPHYLSNLAIENGINLGRNGYGTVYIVASGNGGLYDDNCNFDGYANSIYTVTIGAVDEFGKIPFYAEDCAAMLGVAFSSGGQQDRSIVTTDWTAINDKGCTEEHTGTSAAAPLAAGIVALMLQIRACLTWRDVQYIIILTADKLETWNSSWYTNAAGLHHSQQHGFGLLNAWRAVSTAKIWPSVPWLSTFKSSSIVAGYTIPLYPDVVHLTYNVTHSAISSYYVWILEYVQVYITMQHPCRGRVEIRVKCPSGTESIIATPRKNDQSMDGLNNWPFSTVRCWGEEPVGLWTVTLTDKGQKNDSLGTINEWKLVLHGTPMTSAEFQDRIRLVKDASNGHVLDSNITLPCDPPQPVFNGKPWIGDKMLKEYMEIIGDGRMVLATGISSASLKCGTETARRIFKSSICCCPEGLLLTSIFLVALAIFETLEYMLCYKEEKRKFLEYFEKNGMVQNSHTVEETPLLDVNHRGNGAEVEMHSLTEPLNYADEIPERSSIVQINCDPSISQLDQESQEQDDHYKLEMSRLYLENKVVF